MELGLATKVGEDVGKGSIWKDVRNGSDEEGRTVAEEKNSKGETEESNNTNSSMMLGLLDEFSKIYADRLQRVEDTAMKCDEKEYLVNKVCVLEGWVRDLGEQNAVLVVTVEELEREAAQRVALLEERLTKMAATTRQSCLALRDHQMQVSNLVRDKVGLEKETEGLGERMGELKHRNLSLVEENTSLHTDLTSLIQVISRARQTGQWEADDVTFSYITPEQVFGPVLPVSRRSSQCLKEGQPDYLTHLLEDQGLRKDGSSVASSFSNLQDVESSMYWVGGRGSEKDLVIMRLRADVHNLQSAQEHANRQILERDKQITDLQSQLTNFHQELTTTYSDASKRKTSHTEHHQNKNGNIEVELNENIDTLVRRMREVEGECQDLRDTNRSLQDSHQAIQDTHQDLQNSHTSCSSTITTLHNQLTRSQKAQDELRTVLTSEVAQRHDQVVALMDELKTQEQHVHETQMQLQLKSEVIKELRREVRILREKSDLIPVKDGESSCSRLKEVTSTQTQTSEISYHSSQMKVGSGENSQVGNSAASTPPPQATKESKLQNELEQKLENSRRAGAEKGERMQYLTGQLTSLQLEVGRTHGQAEKLRREVENKTELIQKLEAENSSLTHQLNEKSNTLEKFQTQITGHAGELDKKKKEVCEQRLTISALQDALVSSKRTCDQLRFRLEPPVSGGMVLPIPHTPIHTCSACTSSTTCSIPSIITTSTPSTRPTTHHSAVLTAMPCAMPPAISSPQLSAIPSATNSIPFDSFTPQTNLSTDQNSVDGNFAHPAAGSPSPNNYNLLQDTLSDTGNNVSFSNAQQCSALQPVDFFSCPAKTGSNLPPNVRSPSQCDPLAACQSNSNAFTPDVLSSCSGNSFVLRSSLPVLQNTWDTQQSVTMPKGCSSNVNFVDGKVSANLLQIKPESGQVHDV